MDSNKDTVTTVPVCESHNHEWVSAFKIVPKNPPYDNYPDYELGYTYGHHGLVEVCHSGFHASPSFKQCVGYIKPTKECRFLGVEVFSPVWGEYMDICVTSKIKICQEWSYEEVLEMKLSYISNGDEYHTKGFGFHRDDKDENGYTLPAVIMADGSKKWIKNGKLHRDDKDENGNTLPAWIMIGGSKRWYKNGELHREEKDENGYTLPAWIDADGSKGWYKNDKLYREEKDENGYTLPAWIKADGSRYWFKNGELHQEDKDENGYTLPAVIGADGSKRWYNGGQRHREDKDENGNTLPAWIDADGSKRWFVNGTKHFPTDRADTITTADKPRPSGQWTKIKS